MPCRVQERESTLRLIREEGTHGWHNPCVYIYVYMYIERLSFASRPIGEWREEKKEEEKGPWREDWISFKIRDAPLFYLLLLLLLLRGLFITEAF